MFLALPTWSISNLRSKKGASLLQQLHVKGKFEKSTVSTPQKRKKTLEERLKKPYCLFPEPDSQIPESDLDSEYSLGENESPVEELCSESDSLLFHPFTKSEMVDPCELGSNAKNPHSLTSWLHGKLAQVSTDLKGEDGLGPILAERDDDESQTGWVTDDEVTWKLGESPPKRRADSAGPRDFSNLLGNTPTKNRQLLRSKSSFYWSALYLRVLIFLS